MSKVFVIDVSRCNGCYNCQLACKDEHVGNDWSPYAKAQPEIGQFWCRLNEQVQGSIPKVKIHYIAELCNHCDKPSCMAKCENGAIYKREDGLVIIDPEKCSDCGECAEACPYNAIYRNAKSGICQKCTGCAHLLDNGYALPRCVEACPTDAMKFGDKEDLKELIQGAEVRSPETGNGPRVYYRNIPGIFIGGTLYDPDEKEVLIGAKCRASNGGKHYEVLTDAYGDFWFKDIPIGKYELVLSARGYEYKVIEVDAVKAVNLGDIPIKKK